MEVDLCCNLHVLRELDTATAAESGWCLWLTSYMSRGEEPILSLASQATRMHDWQIPPEQSQANGGCATNREK
eukprot:6477261-Amphidinium_carterae.4